MARSVFVSGLLAGLTLCVGGCIQPEPTPGPAPEQPVDLDHDGAVAEDDCDDADDRRAPGLDEVCDGLDNDCDQSVDEEAADGIELYADVDGDGFGFGAPQIGCSVEAGTTTQDGDCDDADGERYPGAAERCDGLDQDCDDDIDEDPIDTSTWYLDEDSDGYGDPDLSWSSCEAPEGYVSNADDCGPRDPEVSPDGAEVCDAAGLDEDCDGLTESDDPSVSGQSTWYADRDGDGLGSPEDTVEDCALPRGYAEDATDCDDTDPRVAGPETLYVDADGDGYGEHGGDALVCLGTPGYSSDALDCDDTDATVNPSVYDPPYDGIDQDCSASSDYDADADGYDSDLYGGSDCDDADAARNPVATEIYYDGVDQDCDEASDYDADEDGFDAEAYGGLDCDDDDERYGPEASEAPLDGEDQDCDGEDLLDVSWIISSSYSVRFGYQVAVADLSGDGVNELIASAPYASGGGSIYAMAGDSLPVVDSLDSGDAIVTGSSGVSTLGYAMNAAMDADGDGYTDLLLGAPSHSSKGSASVFFGPISTALTFASRDALLSGDWSGGLAGNSIDWAGDTDGDGEQDLIYGAPMSDETGTNKGMAVLALGPPGSPTDDVANLEGQYSFDQAGATVAGAGDTDGDGLADISVGAPYNNDQGAVYVLNGPVSGSFELADADAKWRGNVDGDNLGTGLLGGFDADGDGYTDLWMGATGESTVAADAGAVYLVEGPFTKKQDVSEGEAVVYGVGASDGLGSVLWQGDLDGDGAGDLLVGVPNEGTSNVGTAYALFGPFSGSVSVGDTTARWTAGNSSALAGSAVAAGDIDGDSVVDVISGASGSTPFTSSAGSVYAIFGGW